MVKNLCNLIIVVGINFGANLTVITFLNRWDQSITIGSSQDLKYDHLDMSRYIAYISRYIPIYLRYFTENLTNARVCHIPNIFHNISV